MGHGFDLFSLKNTESNGYNNFSSQTIFNYLSQKKILALTFFLLHVVGYQIIGIIIARIIMQFNTDTSYINAVSTFISESIIVLIYLGFVLFIPELRQGFFKNRMANIGYALAICFICFIIYLFGSNLLSTISSLILPNQGNDNQQLVVELVQKYPAMMIITTALLAPIAEEFSYRFGLVSLFGEKRKVLGIIVSGLVFGLIHFNFFFKSMDEFLVEIVNLPSYIFAGLVFAYLYSRTENGIPSIAIHFINNLIATLIILLM